MIQEGKPDLLHLALVVRRRAGVIDDPIAAAFAVVASVADEDHHVIRKFLNPGLVKEEQVAAPGLTAVAADERGVVIFERARVGEFGEFAVGQVRLPKRPEVGAKEVFAERTSFEVVGFHVGRDGLVAFAAIAYGLEPGPVVAAQRLAPREADKTSAIALVFVPSVAQLIKLHLGYVCEPAAETVPIIGRAQFSGVGDAIIIGIGPDSPFAPLASPAHG